MNSRIRNSLSALAVAASFLSLGYTLGEPPRPGELAVQLGQDAVARIASERGEPAQARTNRQHREHLSMPFFSFGKRASAGAP